MDYAWKSNLRCYEHEGYINKGFKNKSLGGKSLAERRRAFQKDEEKDNPSTKPPLSPTLNKQRGNLHANESTPKKRHVLKEKPDPNTSSQHTAKLQDQFGNRRQNPYGQRQKELTASGTSRDAKRKPDAAENQQENAKSAAEEEREQYSGIGSVEKRRNNDTTGKVTRFGVSKEATGNNVVGKSNEEPKNDALRRTERPYENLQPGASIAEEKVNIDVSEQERREQEQEDTCKVREKEEDVVKEEEQGEGREEGKGREGSNELVEEQEDERREKEGVREEYKGRKEQPDKEEEEPQIEEDRDDIKGKETGDRKEEYEGRGEQPEEEQKQQEEQQTEEINKPEVLSEKEDIVNAATEPENESVVHNRDNLHDTNPSGGRYERKEALESDTEEKEPGGSDLQGQGEKEEDDIGNELKEPANAEEEPEKGEITDSEMEKEETAERAQTENTQGPSASPIELQVEESSQNEQDTLLHDQHSTDEHLLRSEVCKVDVAEVHDVDQDDEMKGDNLHHALDDHMVQEKEGEPDKEEQLKDYEDDHKNVQDVDEAPSEGNEQQDNKLQEDQGELESEALQDETDLSEVNKVRQNEVVKDLGRNVDEPEMNKESIETSEEHTEPDERMEVDRNAPVEDGSLPLGEVIEGGKDSMEDQLTEAPAEQHVQAREELPNKGIVETASTTPDASDADAQSVQRVNGTTDKKQQSAPGPNTSHLVLHMKQNGQDTSASHPTHQPEPRARPETQDRSMQDDNTPAASDVVTPQTPDDPRPAKKGKYSANTDNKDASHETTDQGAPEFSPQPEIAQLQDHQETYPQRTASESQTNDQSASLSLPEPEHSDTSKETREQSSAKSPNKSEDEKDSQAKDQAVSTSLSESKNEDTSKETREQGTVMSPIRTEEKDNQTKDQSTLTSLPDEKATLTSLPVSKNEDTNTATREQGTVMSPIRTEKEKNNQTKDQSTLTSLPDEKATLTSLPVSKNEDMNAATREQGTVMSPIKTEDQATLTSLPSSGSNKESTDTESSRIEDRSAEPVAGSSSTEPQFQKLAADVSKLQDQVHTLQQDKNRLEVEVKTLKSQRSRDASPRADTRAEAIAEPTPPQTTAPRLEWIIPEVLYKDDRLTVPLKQLSTNIHADLVVRSLPSSSIKVDHVHSVVLPVIAASRVGSDLQAAFQKANINVPAVVLIFHHLAPHMCRIRTATKDRLSDRQLVNSSRDMVDLVFWNGNMYECAANTKGVQRLKELWQLE